MPKTWVKVALMRLDFLSAQMPEQHRTLAVEGFVRDLDACPRTQPFLLGDKASLADVAISPFIRQFAAVDRAWFDTADLPVAQRWLAHWLASPVFDAVMARV